MSHPRRLLLVAVALAGVATLAATASAQCILANPSFEIAGSGTVFGGWSQFGSVGSSTVCAHGHAAAKVSGPNTGGWDVSGFWQSQDATAGVTWSGSVCVAHLATRPLTGQSKAIVNVEWRNSGGSLISYESFTAADATTPADRYRVFTFQTQPAPAGTVSARLLLGVLQSPADPVPDVVYDLATFNSLAAPTLEQKQWLDFGARTVTFSGRTWRVKGPGYYSPGPSQFGADTNSVKVDANGRLHLTIKRIGSTWYSSEVALQDALGYGDYVFTTRGRLDTLDPHAVFGLFPWEYGNCYDASYLWWNPYNEVDIEFSRWGYSGNAIAQFVAQPYDYSGNIDRFDMNFVNDEVTSHAIRWLPGRCEFRSWRGGPDAESAATLVHSWTYSGPHVPRPEAPRVHLNLWQFNGNPATNQEVVLDAFTFDPICTSPPCGILAVPPAAPRTALALAAGPNPFRGATTLRCSAPRGGRAELAVFDLAGRRLRTLLAGFVPAGDHEILWNGDDDAGHPLGPGLYFCRFRLDDEARTKRLILVR
jgi:hypothetical protein